MAVKSLCNRALLIEGGCIAMDDAPTQVLDYYNALIALDEAKVLNHTQHIQVTQDKRGVRSGTGEAQICAVHLLRQGRETQQVTVGEPLDLVIILAILQDLPDVTLGVLLRDRLGNEIFGINTHQLGLSDSLAQRHGA